MTDAELKEVLATLAATQMKTALALFETLVIALDRRGAISKSEVVEVLKEASQHLDSIGTLAAFRAAIADLEA